jgi:hypothetical protein
MDGVVRAPSEFDNFGHACFHDGDAAIRGPQVNTDDFSHDVFLQKFWWNKFVFLALKIGLSTAFSIGQ